MEIKLQKRKHKGLKKLTKVDENNNEIEGQEKLYVRIEEVAENLVNTDATLLTDEVFKNINWKDNKALEFKSEVELPEAKSGVTQIVSLENGQVWCVPGSNAEAYKLGAEDISLYLKKNFLESEGVTILGSNAKIGALPADYVIDGNANESTYIEITEGNIGFKVNGEQKHVFNTDKVSFTHKYVDNETEKTKNGAICIENDKVSLTYQNVDNKTEKIENGAICINENEVALKLQPDNTIIGLNKGGIYIKGKGTQISEDLTNNKLNCYTELANAVYGNNTIYLEFYPSLVRFKNANGGELLAIKTDGTIYANSTNRVIDSSIINNYIKAYVDNNLPSMINNHVKTYADNNLPSMINNQMNTYMDANFETRYEREANKNILFEGCSNSLNCNLSSDSGLFHIVFSDTQSGALMIIYFNGIEINSLGKECKSETGYYYQLDQHIATDESDDDYIEILKYNSSGESQGRVWIRGLYRL